MFGMLALALPTFAQEVDCPRGATIRGEAPPRGNRQWCEDGSGRQHGPSIAWDAEGRPRIEAHFEAGAMQGPYRSWHENGQVAESGAYLADRRESGWELFYDDGTRARSQEFRAGRLHGVVREWYPSGQLRLEEHYVDGVRHGPALAYFEGGQKQSEGAFRTGDFDGVWKGWYEDGSPRKVATFERGRKVEEELFPRSGE
jgi:antitoxin component YwqK of YwqJK toxin-antitoxin module